MGLPTVTKYLGDNDRQVDGGRPAAGHWTFGTWLQLVKRVVQRKSSKSLKHTSFSV